MNVSFFSENVKRPLAGRNDVVHGLKDFFKFQFLACHFLFSYFALFKYFNFSFAKFI